MPPSEFRQSAIRLFFSYMGEKQPFSFFFWRSILFSHQDHTPDIIPLTLIRHATHISFRIITVQSSCPIYHSLTWGNVFDRFFESCDAFLLGGRMYHVVCCFYDRVDVMVWQRKKRLVDWLLWVSRVKTGTAALRPFLVGTYLWLQS